jgi:hypothetical protein
MFKSAVCVLLAMFCSIGFAQEAFPFNELVFQGTSAYRPGTNHEYFLFNQGFPQGVRPDEEAAVIAEWKIQHPGAKVVPVSILGEKSRMPIVYVWAVDGEANLNLVLVRNGVYPGIAMLDGTHFSRVLQSSKGAPHVEVLEAQERLGNPTQVPSRRLVSDPRYEDFLKRLIAAETTARADLKGIWSDKFKRQRIRMGITPLSEVQR